MYMLQSWTKHLRHFQLFDKISYYRKFRKPPPYPLHSMLIALVEYGWNVQHCFGGWTGGNEQNIPVSQLIWTPLKMDPQIQIR